jgi:hypothetical protein
MAELSEFEDGRVMVRVRSRRGTGTRDEDEVTVTGVFADVEEAEAESARLSELVQQRMQDARMVGVDGAVVEVGGDAGSDAADDGDGATADDWAADDHVSKVYLGEGADPSGWVPLPEAVVREQVVPLVRRFAVEDGDTDTISVNVGEGGSDGGWTDVDAGVVTRKIAPIVENERLDG